jgi:hypothetical protein
MLLVAKTLVIMSLVGEMFLYQAAASDTVATNLEVMRTLAGRIGERVGEFLTLHQTDTLTVEVKPRETAWYVESSLVAGLGKGKEGLITTTSREATAEFGIGELQVEYTDRRREGILGEEVVNRHIRVTISARVRHRTLGEILPIRDLTESVTDTVKLSAVRFIENPNLPVTRSPVPEGGLFPSLVEPIVVLSAVGVAVFLLFHVRS